MDFNGHKNNNGGGDSSNETAKLAQNLKSMLNIGGSALPDPTTVSSGAEINADASKQDDATSAKEVSLSVAQNTAAIAAGCSGNVAAEEQNLVAQNEEPLAESETSKAMRDDIQKEENVQEIDLSKRRDGASVDIFEKVVRVKACPKTENTSQNDESSASNMIKSDPVVKFEWENKYYLGNLLSLTTYYMAYALTTRTGHAIRVISQASNSRSLLKGFTAALCDVRFYDTRSGLLAAVDAHANLIVVRVSEKDNETMIDLVLHVKPTEGEVEEGKERNNHRINWIANTDSDHRNNDVDDMKMLSDPDLSPAIFLVLTYNNKAEIWNLNKAVEVCEKMGEKKLSREQLAPALTQIYNDADISDSELSPNGTVIALSDFAGFVKFWQVDTCNDEATEAAELIHSWKPHESSDGSVKPVSVLKFLDNLNQPNNKVFWRFVMTGCSRNRELKVWCTVSWECLQTISFDSSIASAASSEGDDNEPELKISVSPSSEFVLVADTKRNVFYIFRSRINSEWTHASLVNMSFYRMTAPIINLDFMKVTKVQKRTKKSKRKKQRSVMNNSWESRRRQQQHRRVFGGDDDEAAANFSSALSPSSTPVVQFGHQHRDETPPSSGDDDDDEGVTTSSDEMAMSSSSELSSSPVSGVHIVESDDDNADFLKAEDVADALATFRKQLRGKDEEEKFAIKFISMQPRELTLKEAQFTCSINRATTILGALDIAANAKDLLEEEDSGSSHESTSTGDADEKDCSFTHHSHEGEPVKSDATTLSIKPEDLAQEIEDEKKKAVWPDVTTTNVSSTQQAKEVMLLTPDAFVTSPAAGDDDVAENRHDETSFTHVTSMLDQSTISSSTAAAASSLHDKNDDAAAASSSVRPIQDCSIDSSVAQQPMMKEDASSSIMKMLSNAQKQLDSKQQVASSSSSSLVSSSNLNDPKPAELKDILTRVAHSPDIIPGISGAPSNENKQPQPSTSSNSNPLFHLSQPSTSQQQPHELQQLADLQATAASSSSASTVSSLWPTAPDVTMLPQQPQQQQATSCSSQQQQASYSAASGVSGGACMKLPYHQQQQQASTSSQSSLHQRHPILTSASSSSSASEQQQLATSGSREQQRRQQPAPASNLANDNGVTSATVNEISAMMEEMRAKMAGVERLMTQASHSVQQLHVDTHKNIQAIVSKHEEDVRSMMGVIYDQQNQMLNQQNEQMKKLIGVQAERFNSLFEDNKRALYQLYQQSAAVQQQQQKSQQATGDGTMMNDKMRQQMIEAFHQEINYRLLPNVQSTAKQGLTEVKEAIVRKMTETQAVITQQTQQLLQSPDFIQRVMDGVASTVLQATARQMPDMMKKAVVQPLDVVAQNAHAQFADTFRRGITEMVNQADEQFKRKVKAELEQLSHVANQIQAFSGRLSDTRTTKYCEADKQLSDEILNGLNQLMAKQVIPRVTSELSQVIKQAVKEESSNQQQQEGSHNHRNSSSSDKNKQALQAAQQHHDLHEQQRVRNEYRTKIRDAVTKSDLELAFRIALTASDLHLVHFLLDMINPQVLRHDPCPLSQPIILSLIQQLACDLKTKIELKLKFLTGCMLSLDVKDPQTTAYTDHVVKKLHAELVLTMDQPEVRDNGKLYDDLRLLKMACRSIVGSIVG